MIWGGVSSRGAPWGRLFGSIHDDVELRRMTMNWKAHTQHILPLLDIDV